MKPLLLLLHRRLYDRFVRWAGDSSVSTSLGLPVKSNNSIAQHTRSSMSARGSLLRTAAPTVLEPAAFTTVRQHTGTSSVVGWLVVLLSLASIKKLSVGVNAEGVGGERSLLINIFL